MSTTFNYFVFQSTFMMQDQEASLKTLQDIRSMMEKSARFISLSGWSGVWAGTIALAGSYVAYGWLNESQVDTDAMATRFIALAITVFSVAFAGAFYFTWRKARQQGLGVWNSASRRMMIQTAIPMVAGAIFAIKFLYTHNESFIVPTCLTFYGLALINGGKYTLSDIRYLGLLEVALGCVTLFFPDLGLTSWIIGFGVLHILYGIIVWNKYDKQISKEEV